MILAIKSHIQDFLEKGILKDVNPREIFNSEGVGLDLSVAEIYEVQYGSGLIGIEVRKTPSSVMIEPYEDGFFHLKSGKTYLLKTQEIFNLPKDICCQFFPRSTLFRSGIIFQSSVLSTGYIGSIVFSIINTHTENFLIEPKARFATAVFMKTIGDSNNYQGQWNNTRISQPDIEKQI